MEVPGIIEPNTSLLALKHRAIPLVARNSLIDGLINAKWGGVIAALELANEIKVVFLAPPRPVRGSKPHAALRVNFGRERAEWAALGRKPAAN
jgi:hypothetical protein